jgi:hypothetical protein
LRPHWPCWASQPLLFILLPVAKAFELPLQSVRRLGINEE